MSGGFRLTREPAAWGAVVVTAVSLLVVFDFPYLQGNHAGSAVT